tara:strand:+ start:3338 stop:4489 length:1152 start_codon:yes stop_codon:yes gene_type:complete
MADEEAMDEATADEAGAVKATADDVALGILKWAQDNAAMASDWSIPVIDRAVTVEPFPSNVAPAAAAEEVAKAEKTLQRIRVAAVAVDHARDRVVVLTRNQVSIASAKVLPDNIAGVPVEYIGQSDIEPNPPHIPYNAIEAAPRCFVHNGRLACGTSVTVAPVHAAGTMGALVSLPDGTLCGLTNNHVTGACNHSRLHMHVLSPSPFDADPDHPAPTAIGRHHSFIQLASGDPRQVALQELDVALFEILLPNAVTSMQGVGLYDTPATVTAPNGGLAVKKVGRTTGLTTGEVIGQFQTPLGIPYSSDRFRSHVYFQNAWAVRTMTGDPFSLPGDSGSLVVTADGQNAVGLVFAGTTSGDVSFIIPISTVLASIGGTLVSAHGT